MRTEKITEIKVTRSDLENMNERVARQLFDVVANSTNWKLPTVEMRTLSAKTGKVMASAIAYFHGGVEIVHKGNFYHVSSKGYNFYMGE